MANGISTPFIYKLFRIRKGEFEKTFLMFLYAFNWVAAFLVGRVLKDTLFLTEADLSLLPYMYIIVAAVVPATWLFSQHIGRYSLKNTTNITMSLIVITLIFFRYLLFSNPNYIVIASLYVFIEIMGVMLMILFWTFANEMFNSREAKRLFGVIAGGQVLANLYGFPLRNFKDYIGVDNLIFVCVASILACMFIFNYLSTRYRHSTLNRGRIRTRSEGNGTIVSAVSKVGIFASLRKHVILLTILTMLTVTIVDYQFKVVASQHFTGSELAHFFFSIYAYTGVLACLIQFFLTSRLLEKYGILIALLILPLAMCSGCGIALVFSSAIGIFITQGGNLVARYTITETTTNLLYQPLPAAMRRQTKAFADGVARPAAMAFAGLVLIVLNYVINLNTETNIFTLSWIIVALCAVLIAVLFTTRQRYVDALLFFSDRRAKVTGKETEDDEKALAVSKMVIQKALNSEDDFQILNAMELIPLSRWSDWDEHILPLLNSPFSMVKQKAIEFLGKSGNRKYSKKIAELFYDESDSVKAVAIQTYCLLENERSVQDIATFLGADSPLVKAATITGLIQYGGLDGIMSSTVELKNMLEHESPGQRKSGAEILGYIKIKSFYQPLFKLINDKDLEVRKAAILAAGQMQAKELIPNLLYLLQSPETNATAVKSLSMYGTKIIAPLEDVLLISKVSSKIRQAIPAILAQIESPKSYFILENLLKAKDVKLRSTVIKSMQRLILNLNRDITPNYNKIQLCLHTELESYYQQFIYHHTLKTAGDDFKLLTLALHDRLQDTLVRIFSLLGILYPKEQIEIVSYNFKSKNQAMRANAIEIVDNICDAETRKYLVPILDNIDSVETIEAGRKLFKLNDFTVIELTRRFLLSDEDDWLVSCTIHAIAKAELTIHLKELIRFADHENPVIRESVLFATSCLIDDADYAEILALYIQEKDPIVSKYMKHKSDSLGTIATQAE